MTKAKLSIDIGLTIPEVISCVVALVPRILADWWPDRKLTVEEIRDLVAGFLRDLASKANAEAAAILEFLAEALDVDDEPGE